MAGRQEHEQWIRKLRERKSTKLTKRQRVANEQAARRAEEEARLAAVDWDPSAVGDQRVYYHCVCVVCVVVRTRDTHAVWLVTMCSCLPNPWTLAG